MHFDQTQNMLSWRDIDIAGQISVLQARKQLIEIAAACELRYPAEI